MKLIFILLLLIEFSGFAQDIKQIQSITSNIDNASDLSFFKERDLSDF